MTIESDTSRFTAAGDDSTTAFDLGVDFIFYDTSDLSVSIVDDVTGTVTTLTEGVDYTVSGGSGATGTVTLIGSYSGGLASDTTLIVLLDIPLKQLADFVNGEISDAEVSERVADRLTKICQQLEEKIGRTLRASIIETAIADLPTPVERRGKLFFFSDTATADPSVASAGDLGALVVLDEDTYASDSAIYPPSQQSTAVYIATQIAAAIASALTSAYQHGWRHFAGSRER